MEPEPNHGTEYGTENRESLLLSLPLIAGTVTCSKRRQCSALDVQWTTAHLTIANELRSLANEGLDTEASMANMAEHGSINPWNGDPTARTL